MTETEKLLNHLDQLERKIARKKDFECQVFHEFRRRFFDRWTWEQVVEERSYFRRLHLTRSRVRKNVKTKGLDMVATFTLNETQDRTEQGLAKVQDRMRKAFALLGVDYCLMPEYHPGSTEIHFHGFIKVHDETLLQPKLYAQGTKKEGRPVVRYGRPIYTLAYFEKNFGFATLSRLNPNAIGTQVNYMTKYCTKSTDFNLMVSKRPKKPRFNSFERVKGLFGDMVKWED